MKKRIIAVIIGFVLIVITIFFQFFFVHKRLYDWFLGKYENMDSKPAILYVNGNEVCSDHVIIYRDNGPYPNFSEPSYSAQLPFIPVLEEMGANIIWQNDYVADVYIEDERYCLILNCSFPKFTYYGSDKNLIPEHRWGGHLIVEPVARELILDFGAVIDVLDEMDVVEYIFFDGDYDKGYIYYDIKLK
ncbi:MAG: hypothetical protein IJN85_01365 [Oscillospiraceae bacterium]|nr:hypothetical protein [Oscillospiraceae bacterium]